MIKEKQELKNKINEQSQIHKREGRRPKIPYKRPVRDGIIERCLAENRQPTPLEISEISLETSKLARSGYYLLSMKDEDHAVIDQLPFNDGDDDSGPSGLNLRL